MVVWIGSLCIIYSCRKVAPQQKHGHVTSYTTDFSDTTKAFLHRIFTFHRMSKSLRINSSNLGLTANRPEAMTTIMTTASTITLGFTTTTTSRVSHCEQTWTKHDQDPWSCMERRWGWLHRRRQYRFEENWGKDSIKWTLLWLYSWNWCRTQIPSKARDDDPRGQESFAD